MYLLEHTSLIKYLTSKTKKKTLNNSADLHFYVHPENILKALKFGLSQRDFFMDIG